MSFFHRKGQLWTRVIIQTVLASWYTLWEPLSLREVSTCLNLVSLFFFISKAARDPINHHAQWGCNKAGRVHGSHTDDALLFFSCLLVSFMYQFSFLYELCATQEKEFLYEVKCEISRTELLMRFGLVSTMDFLRDEFV